MQELHGSVPLVRFGTQYLFDAGAWVVALFLAEVFRYEFDLGRIAVLPLLALFAAACLVQFFAGGVYHLYQGRHIYGSFAELRSLLGVVLVSTIVLGIPVAVAGTVVGIPRSTVFIALPIAFVLMGGVRYLKRLLVERSMVPNDDIQKALIFGAGYMGASIARRMTTDRNSPFLPVGLIDDDPLKSNL